MDTNEIIAELRDWAIVQGPGSLAEILNEAADSLEDLDERVAIMSEPHGWISVKDRLPSEFSDCIVFAYGYSQPAQYMKDGKFFTPDNYEAEEIKGVTHWMPYPEGPKEEHDEP